MIEKDGKEYINVNLSLYDAAQEGYIRKILYDRKGGWLIYCYKPSEIGFEYYIFTGKNASKISLNWIMEEVFNCWKLRRFKYNCIYDWNLQSEGTFLINISFKDDEYRMCGYDLSINHFIKVINKANSWQDIIEVIRNQILIDKLRDWDPSRKIIEIE